MPLKATSNEHPGKIMRVRDRVKDLVVLNKPLPGGDYCFEAHGKVVAIEVKWSLSDLFDSLQTRGEAGGPRLAVEVRRMLAYADIPILVTPPIHDRGDGLALRDDGEKSGWQYSSIKGILTDVALYGCIVDEWDGDIAQRIAQLYYVISQQEHQWIQQRGRPDFISLDPTYSQAVWALCSVDKVGPVTAEALLSSLGSIVKIGQSSVKELCKVQGVGPTIAKNLLEVLQHG